MRLSLLRPRSGRSRPRTRSAVLVAAALGASAITTVASVATATAPSASVFVPITPCRLLDTRPGDTNVGARDLPLGAGETITVSAWGASGSCTIPTGATALSMNVVSIEPTASSFLTVFPAGSTRPTASSLNWVGGQSPTPNSVTAAVSDIGGLSFYNLAGSVHLAVDVVGYYAPPSVASNGPAGPAGPVGPAGSPGADGVQPANEVWVAPSGGDFTTVTAALASITDASPTNRYVVRLAPGVYDEPAGVVMKSDVDLVGSGDVSVIRSTDPLGTIRSDSISYSLRDLSVVNTAGHGIMIDNDADHGAAVSITDVEVSVGGTSTILRGIESYFGVLDVDGVRVSASGATSVVTALMWDHADGSGRDLVLEVSSNTASNCSAVYAGFSNLTLSGVEATVDGCATFAQALYLFDADVTMTDVVAHATVTDFAFATAVDNVESRVEAERLVAIADGVDSIGVGLDVDGSTAVQVVRDAELHGTAYSAREGSGATVIFDTVFDGLTQGLVGQCIGGMTLTLDPYSC